MASSDTESDGEALPMGAVAYTPEALTRLMDAGEFYDFRFVRGNWSGALSIASASQDALIVYAN